jgi:hypothetical protein
MVVAADDLKAGYRNRGGSWHFKASEVSDFAFALSDHYLWEAAVQPVGDRQVLVSSVYPVQRAQECAGLTALQQRSMRIFSDTLPGIPYPYPAFTTFVGTFQGGMEFPMMANNDAPRARVTVHEMFHTYFPMYVRTNEKRFAWMDEGWAAYVTAVVLKRHLQGNPAPVFSADAGSMQAHNGMSDDLPLMTPTRYLDGSNYFYHSYHLPAFAYSLMHQHLGDELFLKCFREYIRRWAKKSPTPYDFFYTFENVSGQDLGWLWESWFFEPGYADVAVKSLKGRQLTVLNRGTRPVPLHVAVKYQNGQTRHVYSGAAGWQKKETQVLSLPDEGPVESVHLNPDIPDRSVADNFYPPLADRYKSFPPPGDLAGLYRFQEFPATAVLDWQSGLVRVRVPEAGIDAFLIPRSRTVLESLDGQITMELPEGPTSGFRFKHKGFGVDFTTKRL